MRFLHMMKIFSLLILVLMYGNAGRAAVDYAAMLRAIADVETGNRPLVGKAGERTAYQMLRTTWSTYTGDAFELAGRDPARDKRVAAAHLQYLIAYLASRRSLTPENLASAWHRGPRAYRIHDDYSTRVSNLYVEYSSSR